MSALKEYKGSRYIAEKQVLVIDVGHAYTKFGFVSEAAPRGIVRSEIKCPNTDVIRNIFSYKDQNDLYELLVEFLHSIFFKKIMISAKDIKVVNVESPLVTTEFRNILTKVLFRHFEVGAIMFLPTHLVTTCTLACQTVLVLDVGYEEASVIPIYEGVPILKAWQALPLGAKAVHKTIMKAMQEILTEEECTEKLIEDIKVRTCFVTTMERSAKLLTDNPPTPPPNVKYFTKRSLEIPGTVRESAFEKLWERDLDNLSIPTMILDSIIKCPIDARKPLAENILLIGGTVMTTGFITRLKSELEHIINNEPYSEKLTLRKFKFHTAPSKANYTAWLGGAIFGIAADLPSRCLSKEAYLETNHVPDWVCLIDNRKDDGENIEY